MTPLLMKNIKNSAVFYSEEYGFLGHLLYSERIFQGISIEKVALELKLSSYIIKNLETGYLSQSPGLSYMLGFLRTYASYLGLDEKEISNCVHSVKNTFFEEEPVLKVPFQKRQLPSKTIVWGSTLGLGITILGYVWFKSLPIDEPGIYSVTLIDHNLRTLPQTTNYSNEDLSHSINEFLNIYQKPFTHNHTPPPLIFQLCFNSDTWIALKDSKGYVVREGVLHKGDDIELPLDFEGVLQTGNAGGIYLKYGTQVSSAFGSPGQVVQNFPLNLKKILQNPSNPANN